MSVAAVRLNPIIRQIRAFVEPHTSLSDAELLDQFIHLQDEAAFSALLHRHGPLVLAVARRILPSNEDAEDVFQATFLLLARRAKAIRRQESLACWLHGVARRLAVRARLQARRRVAEERRAGCDRARADLPRTSWHQLEAVLDDALAGLPARYRVPLIECYLRGKTQEEVARDLDRPVGTVRSWVARGRALLRTRLARRGVSLSAAGLGTVLLANAVRGDSPFTPPRLRECTLRAAKALASGQAATDLVSSSVATLVVGAGRVRHLPRYAGLFLAFAFAVVTAGAGLTYCQSLGSANQGTKPDSKVAQDSKQAERRVDVHGDALPEQALARLGTVRFRPGDFAASLAFTRDGKQLLHHPWEGPLRAMDPTSGRETEGTPWPPGPVRSFSQSSDGQLYAVVQGAMGDATGEKHIRVWDPRTGRKPRDLAEGRYLAVRFAPLGGMLAATREDGQLEIWDAKEARLLRSWKASDRINGPLNAFDHRNWFVRFGPGGLLVSGHPFKGIRIWNTETGAKVREIAVAPTVAGAVAVSPESGRLAVGTGVGRVHVFNLKTGDQERVLAHADDATPGGVPHGILAVEFSHNGKSLAVLGTMQRLRVWDVTTGKERRHWNVLASFPCALAFSPDDKRLASTDGGTSVRVFDLAGPDEDTRPSAEKGMVMNATFVSDGTQALTSDGIGSHCLWDSQTGRFKRRLSELTAERSLFASDAYRLYVATEDSTVVVRELASGKEVRRLTHALGTGKPNRLVVSRDGTILALLGKERGGVLLDARSGKEFRRLVGDSLGASGAAFSEEGLVLTVWGTDRKARVFDTATGKERLQIPFVEVADPKRAMQPPGVVGGGFYHAALSPDGRLLAFGSANRFLVIHELAAGREIRRLSDLPEGVAAMAFSQDGRSLAWSGDRSPVIRLVEVESGKERHTLTGHRSRVWSLAFSPDGRRLLSGSQDTTALIWDLASPLATLEGASLWKALSSDDATQAYRAVRRLAESSVAFRGRMKPVEAANRGRASELITRLDSNDFSVRNKAATDLEALGEGAVAACREALSKRPSLEVSRRLETFLDRQIRGAWVVTPERLQSARVLEALELAATPEARAQLKRLAEGAPGYRLTDEARAALRRLERRAPTQ
jgi:RNA polymerase sigma factor (sigma-70 family)